MSEKADEADSSATEHTGATAERLGVVEFSQLVREHQNTYIRVADNKASILLSGLIAYLGLALGVIGSRFDQAGLEFSVVASISVIFAVVAIAFAAAAVYPNTPETPQGLFMWESVTADSLDEYREKLYDASEMDLIDELIDENYKLAEVNDQKYTRVRGALYATVVTVISGLISVLLIVG